MTYYASRRDMTCKGCHVTCVTSVLRYKQSGRVDITKYILMSVLGCLVY